MIETPTDEAREALLRCIDLDLDGKYAAIEVFEAAVRAEVRDEWDIRAELEREFPPCPNCGHRHLDYLNDEGCVSCGCPWAESAQELAALREAAQAVLTWWGSESVAFIIKEPLAIKKLRAALAVTPAEVTE